jgi:hypothetical protein
MRESCSVGPRVLLMTPEEFDSMGPRSVVLWTPSRTHVRGKSGEIRRYYGHVEVNAALRETGRVKKGGKYSLALF